MTLGERYFAWLMRRASGIHEPLVATRKQSLLGELSGNILEIGAGDGVNLKYLPKDVCWNGFEPNGALARDIRVPSGGHLRLGNYRHGSGKFDAALSTLVLCSVQHPEQVLKGIHADLVLGGKFVFLEHVAAPANSSLRKRQDRWMPLWRFCAGGCHPNRDTESMIRAAGFEIENIERFDLPLGLAGPHIAGVAVKR